MTGGTKGQGKGRDTVETGVAVRMMAVSMAATPGQSPTAREAQFAQQGAGLAMMGDAGPAVGPEGYGTIQNVSQASWTMTSSTPRRSVPAWMQRLGAFIEGMRAQQPGQPLWNPSPFSSPAKGDRVTGPRGPRTGVAASELAASTLVERAARANCREWR